MDDLERFEELFWKDITPEDRKRFCTFLKWEYDLAKEWWLKALETIRKDQADIESLKSRYQAVLNRLDRADAEGEKDRANDLHYERRDIEARLKKLGVEISS
jgi:DNA repair exonuclease SbcCD ATPase subunit